MKQDLPAKNHAAKIGITCGREKNHDRLNEAYAQAVWEAGGIPFLLPASPGSGRAESHLAFLDGLILSGGGDLDPIHYGQEPQPGLGSISPDRDSHELALARLSVDWAIPVLGICRGIQVLAVALGGTLHQTLQTGLKHRQDAPEWYPTHEVKVTPGSKLRAILGESVLRVNSYHHQAVDRVPAGFSATALAHDGCVEGIEAADGPWAVGVQWHPELMAGRHPSAGRLFRALVEDASKRNP